MRRTVSSFGARAATISFEGTKGAIVAFTKGLAPHLIVFASDESRDVVGEVLGFTGGKPLG